MKRVMDAFVRASSLGLCLLLGCGSGSTFDPRDGGGADAGAAADSGGAAEDAPSFGGDGGADAAGCQSKLAGVVRDFGAHGAAGGHPDFERYGGTTAVTGIVAADLGSDGKPVYAHAGATGVTTGRAEFDQWYRDVAGVNVALPVELPLSETKPGVFTYDSDKFFPIDGKGLGNGPKPEHNFLFTTEVHLSFKYRGGEVFTFRGDDDLWVFVNGKLVMDLGGLHPQLTGTVDLDQRAAQIGLVKGREYPMDLFHAERHTDESTFHIETTIRCLTPR
jgi:fibro-slime domain-containing protein